MKILLRFGLILLCAGTVTASLLSLLVMGVLGTSPGDFVQKMNSQAGLYLFPALILVDCCCFINDSFVYLASESRLDLGLGFSEVRFTYDQDTSDTPIPLKTKVLHVYPVSMVIILLIFALVLVTR
jgi:hypothetical protein